MTLKYSSAKFVLAFSVFITLGACSHTPSASTKVIEENQTNQSYAKQDQGVFGPQLSYAVSSGNLTLVKELIFSGEDVNAANPVGETPLVIAINKGDNSMVRLLLKHGAQPNYLDIGTASCNRLLAQASAGETRFYNLPLDIARKKGKQNIVRLLTQYGAKSASDCFEKENTERRIFEEQSNKHYYE